MADLELSFTINQEGKRKRWQEGRFEINGLTVVDTGDNYEIDYEDLELFVDGEPYDGSASNWAGQKYTAEQIFDQVLSGYLMNEGIYSSFSDDWSVFSDLNNLKEYEGDLLIKLPIFKYDEICVYELDLATPDNRYYSYIDEVMMLDNNNEVVTDVEEFYMEALEEDVTNILQGDLECLYMGYNVKEMIKEMGGEDAWLEEFGDA